MGKGHDICELTVKITEEYAFTDIPHPQKISIQNQLIENYVAI